MTSAARTSTRQRLDRAKNSPAARTRTQQRRDRAKIARIRMIDSYKRATFAVKQWSHLRPVRQTDAGDTVPSTGAAFIRRQQRAKAEARRLANWMREAGL